MPTSSQAMILLNYEGNKKNNGLPASKSQFSFRDPAHLAVATIYNINGFYTIPAGAIKDREAIGWLGQGPAQLFKYHKFPKGYRSVLSFDPLTDTVHWRVLGGDDTTSETGEVVAGISGSETRIPTLVEGQPVFARLSGSETNIPALSEGQVPALSEAQRPFTTDVRQPPRPVINKDTYERLNQHGFRGSAFSLTEPDDAKKEESGTSLRSKCQAASSHHPCMSQPLGRKPELRKTLSQNIISLNQLGFPGSAFSLTEPDDTEKEESGTSFRSKCQAASSHHPCTSQPVERKPELRKTVSQNILSLIQLGFRGSAFSLTELEDTKKAESGTSLRSKNQAASSHHTYLSQPVVRKPELRKTLSEEQKQGFRKLPLRKTVSEQHEPKPNPHIADERTDEDSGPSAAASDESISPSLDEDFDPDLDPDGFYRILPSIYMCKEMPTPRPRSAIFSFRDNEVTTHYEVRELIQDQTGLRITGLQFDPLRLRTKPGLKNRWIADFESVDDLESFVQKGLRIGKDKIIIYKYDDIAKREFSSFKYFKTVQDAKKSMLKGSKSQKSTEKLKKYVRLKETRSFVKDHGVKR